MEKKFYNQLTMEQRKMLRGQLDKVIALRKQQVGLFEKTFIKPLKRQIELAEMVKKNEISLKQYVESNEKWSKWLKEFFHSVTKEEKPFTCRVCKKQFKHGRGILPFICGRCERKERK